MTLTLLSLLPLAGLAKVTLIDFANPGPPFPRVTDRGKEKPSVKISNDVLNIEAPNFWTSIAQLEQMGRPTGGLEPEDTLQLSVRGEVSDDDPALVVILFSSDWRRASAYQVPLKGLSDEEFKTFKATSSLGKPLTDLKAVKDKQALRLGETIGAVQILTKAERGNQPWDIEIAKITFG